MANAAIFRDRAPPNRGQDSVGWAPKSSLATRARPHAMLPPGMVTKRKPLSVRERTAYHSLEDVVGCKWSAGVVASIAEGVTRPGELERHIPGISTKVLGERLRKLLAYGIITRTEFPGLPARVEYRLTPSGRKLARLLRQLRDLNAAHHAPPAPPAS